MRLAAQPPPEPIVSEETGRAAINDLTRRVVDTQVKAGVPIPGGQVVDDWVRPIVDVTIKKHEERIARTLVGEDQRTVPDGEPVSRIDRGDTGEYEPIVRTLAESNAPQAARHLRPQILPMEDARLLARLQLIEREFPEFMKLIHAAADDATQVARNGGLEDTDSNMRIVRASAVLKMAELSGMPAFVGGLGLGDYLNPAPNAPTKVCVQLPGGAMKPLKLKP